MKGIQISLTSKERKLLLDALNEYIDLSEEFSFEASEQFDKRLDEGLGKVMFKLYRGLIGEQLYEKYNSMERKKLNENT